jgi:hypothetical protein
MLYQNAQAVVNNMDVVNALKSDVEQTAKSTTENPLNVIVDLMNSMVSGLSMPFIIFIIAITIVAIFFIYSGGLDYLMGKPPKKSVSSAS